MNKKIFIVMSFLAVFGIAGLFAQEESSEVQETQEIGRAHV